jgi:hypothetical protein
VSRYLSSRHVTRCLALWSGKGSATYAEGGGEAQAVCLLHAVDSEGSRTPGNGEDIRSGRQPHSVIAIATPILSSFKLHGQSPMARSLIGSSRILFPTFRRQRADEPPSWWQGEEQVILDGGSDRRKYKWWGHICPHLFDFGTKIRARQGLAFGESCLISSARGACWR